ncbi:hypothetical protein HDV01_003612 [Terramyces sp. JEL0728]|nr:hypothetical protein HDV01_003612 [Terramyces sp. JEL0728]
MKKVKKGEKPNLLLTLLGILLFPILGLILSTIINGTAVLLSPLFVQMLIELIDSGYQEKQFINNGYLLAVIIFALQLVSVFCTSFQLTTSRRISQVSQSALMSAIYQKMFRLSSKSRSEFSSGRVMTMITTDVNQTCDFFINWGNAIMIPFQVILTIILIHSLVGSAVNYGLVVLGITAMFVFVSGSMQGVYFRQYAKAQDNRLAIVRDMLLGIKMIKYRVLESEFYNKNIKARSKQIKSMIKIFGNNTMARIWLGSVQNLLLLTVIGAYSQSHTLTPGVVFPVVGYCASLLDPITSLLNALGTVSQGFVAVKRISAFLFAEELDDRQPDGQPGCIKLQNIIWQWPKVVISDSNEKSIGKSNESEKNISDFKLEGINVTIQPGTLVAVIGSVGSGKSSFINGLLNELELVSGNATICGRIAFCPQTPWIIAGTIEDNILFGAPLNSTKMTSVIEAAGMARDLQILPGGIKSYLGENGVSLSGGQKARVALARALYSDSDIYLLDCPLAALDSKVSQAVFERGIKEYLKDKTVIMVTHNHSYLNRVDKIIVMDKGKIAESGSFEDMVAIPEGHLVKLLENRSFYIEKPLETEHAPSKPKTKTAAVVQGEHPANNIVSKEEQAKSPLISWYSESLTGLSTIRAFKLQKFWIKKQRFFLDEYQAPMFIYGSLPIWMSLRLGVLCSFIALIIGLVGANPNINAQMATSIGISLTYASQIADVLKSLIIAAGLGEAEMNSIERLLHYAHEIPQEPLGELSTDPSKEAWPVEGKIRIESLKVAYDSRPDIDVVDDLTITVNPGEKLGIVGRTGSGKSTLVSSLFRISNSYKGKITIDGVEISRLGIHTLRRGMFMIPQEPILFEGTVRSNIDIKSEFSDEKIWDALEICGLKSYISTLEGGLEYAITAEGSNFSNGQRQLLSIVGAILHKPKLIVLDEATSALDSESDDIIQSLIHNHLDGSTVVTIAHRLNTIAAYDKVLVLDKGKLIEYGSPKSLLSKEGSLLNELSLATGPSNYLLIKKLAGVE